MKVPKYWEEKPEILYFISERRFRMNQLQYFEKFRNTFRYAHVTKVREYPTNHLNKKTKIKKSHRKFFKNKS